MKAPHPGKAGWREWLGLAVIALPCLLYSMDLTVLNLAVPHLSADLRPSAAELLWIVDIYGFFVAGSLITMGSLGDRIGRRKLLLIGAAAFGACSVFAAFSTSASMLIVARALLGVAAATLAPSTLSLIRNMFHDDEERTLAIGIWIASYSVGGAIGPLLGGALLAHFWWGSVFLLAVPVMLLLLLVGPILLPEFRDPTPARLDLASAALSMVAVLSTIYGIKRLAEEGPGGWAIGAIVAGIAIGAAFIARQKRVPAPLIDLNLFRSRVFSVGLVINTVGFFIAFAAFFFIAQYLQLVLGMGPLEAGLWTTTSAAGFIAGSMTAPLIVRRFRPAQVMAGGYGLAAIGFALLAQADSADALPMVIAGYVILSLGLAPVFTMAVDMIVGIAPPERAGAAAALQETSSEFGGALGIALLGSVLTAVYRSAMIDAPAEGIPADVLLAARSTLANALEVAGQLSNEAGFRLLHAARAAFVQGLEATAWMSAAGALAAGLAAASFLRGSGGPAGGEAAVDSAPHSAQPRAGT